MGRSFDAQGLIDLPKLTAGEAAALGRQILTTAGAAQKRLGGPLPAAIAGSYRRLEAALGQLEEALRERLQPDPIDPEEARRADVAVDAVWSGMADWLSGWAKLPPSRPEALRARALRGALFPDGLRFTQLRFVAEWQEVERRLAYIAKERLEGEFTALGGAAFLAEARASHARYGQVLGITEAKAAAGGEPAPVAEPYARFLEALRDYLLKAAAHADPDAPGSAALAAELTAPVREWVSRAPKAQAGEQEGGGAGAAGTEAGGEE